MHSKKKTSHVPPVQVNQGCAQATAAGATANYINQLVMESQPPEYITSKNPQINLPDYYISTRYEKEYASEETLDASEKEHNMLWKLQSQTAAIKRLALCGTAGSGKTTLAQHYLQGYQVKHPEHLTWILRAETSGQWWQSLRDWAEDLHPRFHETLKAETDLGKQQILITRAIQKSLKERSWCVLVDNWDGVHGQGVNIHAIMNLFCGTGTLLITTQQQSFWDKRYTVDLSHGFTPEESLCLLHKTLSLSVLSLSEDALGEPSAAEALVKTLNHLPLAIVVAGRYLFWENETKQTQGEQNVFSYQDYHTLLQSKITALQRHDNLKDKGDVPCESSSSRAEWERLKTQEAAVDLSLEKAMALDVSPEKPLRHVLCFTSFLASDGIPQQLIKDYLSKLPTENQTPLNKRFNDVLNAAQRYSLIQYEPRRSSVDGLFTLHIHRVIQRVLQERYAPWTVLSNSSTEAVLKPMREALEQRFFVIIDQQQFAPLREYLPHIVLWVTHGKTLWNEKDILIEHAFLQTSLANAYNLLGNFEQAEDLYREALAVITLHYGGEHIQVAEIQQNLAATLQKLGHYTKAEALYRKALATSILHYGMINHIQMAKMQQNLATTLQSLGQYNEAKDLYQNALATEIAYYGTTAHIEVALIQQNLAAVLQELGHHEEAEILCREALATTITYYNTTEHLRVAETQHSLANVLFRLGKYTDAEALYQEALVTTTAHYGTTTHIEVALIQQSLANVLSRLGKCTDAEALHQEALVTTKAYYGTTPHIEVARTQQNLANALWELGKYMDAEALHQEALVTATAHYGTTACIEVAEMQQNLATVWVSLKRYEAAEALFQEVLATKITHYGTTACIEVAETQQNLAGLLQQCKQYTNAEALYREVLATRIAHYGTTPNIEVAVTQQNLAIVLASLGHLKEAEALFQEVLATKIAHYGSTAQISVAITQLNLATLLAYSNKAEALLLLHICSQTFQTQAGGEPYLESCHKLIKIVSNAQSGDEEVAKLKSYAKTAYLSFFPWQKFINSENLDKTESSEAVIQSTIEKHNNKKLIEAAKTEHADVPHYRTSG